MTRGGETAIAPRQVGGDAGRGRRRGSPACRDPERWEYEVLRLLAEQAAVPFDQLARFLGCEPTQARRVAAHLTEAGYTDYARILHGEPHWLWLTHRGARLSGTELQPRPPRIGAMARTRAVNEIRLQVHARAPGARWICWRSVLRDLGMSGYRPNAVVEVDGERHAIVVRLGISRRERFCDALATHMRRYDAVVVFATPAGRRQAGRLAGEHDWPKLVVRALPEGAYLGGSS
jgi:hypothetical protein